MAAGAVVRQDVMPYALVAGVPARHKGWMSRFGESLDLPVAGEGKCTCLHTGEVYSLKEGRISVTESCEDS